MEIAGSSVLDKMPSALAPTSDPLPEAATVPGMKTLDVSRRVLRHGPARTSEAGSHSGMRTADDIAEEGARRIGTIAILTVVTTVGVAVLQHKLQPEVSGAQQTWLYRLSALALILAAAGLATIQRAAIVSARTLLDLGLALEIAGSFALSLMDNTIPWQAMTVRSSAPVAAWIAIWVVLVPNQPWKSSLAASLSAALVPAAHLVAARALHYAPLRWNVLTSYALGPIFVAAWTPFVSTRLRRIQEQLSRARQLGSYHLERLLGRGGMGEVWLARHRFLRRQAAVKVIRSSLFERVGFERIRAQKRFEAEAQAIASLRSPHTVAIYDFGVADDESLYYAMEFLEGLDTQQLVRHYGPQPAGRVIRLLLQVCESLEEAHEAQLVHRDIKPSNIFVTRLGKRGDFVKLLDFGLVKRVSGSRHRSGARNEMGGTPAFMAPEQVRGTEVDARTDIYGLGCVAYFLLTGHVLFDRTTPASMMLAHVKEQPKPPSKRSPLHVPESLDRVVLACLAKSPESRPQSAAQLRTMLRSCAGVKRWTDAESDAWWSQRQPVRESS